MKMNLALCSLVGAREAIRANIMSSLVVGFGYGKRDEQNILIEYLPYKNQNAIVFKLLDFDQHLLETRCEMVKAALVEFCTLERRQQWIQECMECKSMRL